MIVYVVIEGERHEASSVIAVCAVLRTANDVVATRIAESGRVDPVRSEDRMSWWWNDWDYIKIEKHNVCLRGTNETGKIRRNARKDRH